MRYLALIILLSCTQVSLAQIAPVYVNKHFTDEFDTLLRNHLLYETDYKDSFIFISMSSYNYINPGPHNFSTFIKSDMNGNSIRRYIDTFPLDITWPDYAKFHSFISTNDSFVFFGGANHPLPLPDSMSYTPILTKTDRSLNEVWQITLPDYMRAAATVNILPYTDGSVFVLNLNITSSSSSYFPIENATSSIFRIGREGTLLLDTFYSSLYYHNGFGLVKTEDLHLLLSGSTHAWGAGGNAFIQKLDTLGNEMWRKVYEPAAYRSFFRIIHKALNTSEENYYTVGYVAQSTSQPSKSLIYKVNHEGNELWSLHIGSDTHSNWFVGGIATRDGGVVGVGTLVEGSDTADDYYYGWACKLDKNGNELWRNKYTNTAILYAYQSFGDVEELPNGDLVMTGTSRDYDEYGRSTQFGWFVRTDSMGCIYEDCYNSIINPRRKYYNISLYPNPSVGMVNIELPSEVANNELTLSVVDINGRQLIEKTLAKSTHQQIDLSHLPKGNYILVFKNEEGYDVGKVTLK